MESVKDHSSNAAFARRSHAAADGEPDNCRPCMIRSAACPGHIVRIAPKQHLAQIHHEARDIGRHYRGGRRPF